MFQLSKIYKPNLKAKIYLELFLSKVGSFLGGHPVFDNLLSQELKISGKGTYNTVITDVFEVI